MRRNQQSNPLCEVQKVHSMGHREHAEERSVGQTQSFQDCSTSSSSSGRSFAGMWPSKSYSKREREHRRTWFLFFIVETLEWSILLALLFLLIIAFSSYTSSATAPSASSSWLQHWQFYITDFNRWDSGGMLLQIPKWVGWIPPLPFKTLTKHPRAY